MKRYGILTGFAFVVLVFAAIWLGGLNQDEGWSLYAARLVAEGRLPYRDFFYTQGPLMPLVYSVFAKAWEVGGLLGGRIVTAAIGFLAMAFVAATARLLAPAGRKGAAALIAFMLLGSNIYHIYNMSIPKTYALGGFFLTIGFYLLSFALVRLPEARLSRNAILFASGVTMALAAGARISLGLSLAVAGVGLLVHARRLGLSFVAFGLGGALGLAAVYGPFILEPKSCEGFLAAVNYHMSRTGHSPMFVLGSLSRLVRWYLPLWVLMGMVVFRRKPSLGLGEDDLIQSSRLPLRLMVWTFLAIFALQMSAPFPYEDYQVPIMGLLAAYAAAMVGANVMFSMSRVVLLTLGMTWAVSFGSPLFEDWTTNGHDRFWTRVKEKSELAQLQDASHIIEAADPGGTELLTQDLYLAIETNRKVPEGLEMGPFSMLSADEWRKLLASAPCKVAAFSGYAFAIEPPACNERPVEEQMEFWSILKEKYALFARETAFGQHATPLLVLRRKDEPGETKENPVR